MRGEESPATAEEAASASSAAAATPSPKAAAPLDDNSPEVAELPNLPNEAWSTIMDRAASGRCVARRGYFHPEDGTLRDLHKMLTAFLTAPLSPPLQTVSAYPQRRRRAGVPVPRRACCGPRQQVARRRARVALMRTGARAG